MRIKIKINIKWCCYPNVVSITIVSESNSTKLTYIRPPCNTYSIALNPTLSYNRKKRYYISLHPDYSEAQEERDRDWVEEICGDACDAVLTPPWAFTLSSAAHHHHWRRNRDTSRSHWPWGASLLLGCFHGDGSSKVPLQPSQGK